ncbi:MAG: hypothetical protein IIB71_00635 [Proteobacteria bacterium]|nr:hypothetical protein [Pseudomonadota bacterium]
MSDYYMDPTGTKSLEFAMTEAEFTQNDRDIINLGLRGPHIWVRTRIRNAGDIEGAWVYSLNRALLEVVEIYLIRDGSPEMVLSSNKPESIRHSYKKYGTLAFPLKLAPGERVEIFVHYLPPNWSGLPLDIRDVESFENQQTRDLIIYFAIMIGVMTLICYNTVPFVFTARRTFFLYAGAQAALFIFYSHLEGMTTVYL